MLYLYTKTIKMKIHLIYIITNILTQKSYVGYHSTYNINDNYLGSGKIITKLMKRFIIITEGGKNG